MQDMCNIEVIEKEGPTVLSSVNNRLVHQLTIDIPKDTFHGSSIPIHDTYPYYMPPYPAQQCTGLLMNQHTVHPMLKTNKELPSPIHVSPPQMYIVQGTVSDQDPHTSYEYDATEINSEGSSNEYEINSEGSSNGYEINSEGSSNGYEINSHWSSNGSEINNQRSPESERELDSSDSSDSLTNKDKIPINILSSSTKSFRSTNIGKQKRNRTNYTTGQIQELERTFLGNQYPDHRTLELLCRDLSIPESRLKIWFQNKRAKCRRQGKEKPQTMMPQMGLNEMLPPYHPMLHGSPAHLIQHPLFHPRRPMGMDSHFPILDNPSIRSDLHLTISQQGDLSSLPTLSTASQQTLLSASLQSLETSQNVEKNYSNSPTHSDCVRHNYYG
ncbi:RAX [Mytilus coruscus]|uniref:RAX n=1 Tax=Mytilus coruscus TaxID=42192 RepID=A0A6J8CL77_MYTCO|nr:RAX [Mytilus coruscus]